MRIFPGLIAVMLLLGAGLSACSEAPVGGSSVDLETRREALYAADAEFAALALEQGLDVAYERFLADKAVQLPDGGMPLTGKEAIMANVLMVVADNDFTLRWEAVDAVVSASGDMGFTWGNYYLEGLDASGVPYTADGKYANVWQYTAANGWQVLLDMSNRNEPPFPNDLGFDLQPEDEQVAGEVGGE